MTEPRKPSNPEARARAYAEETLGVDAVYQRANEAIDTLEDRLSILHKTGRKRRQIDAHITDREMELTSDERAANPEMSQAAFDKHIKVVLHRDPDLDSLRADRATVASEHEQAEQDAELARIRARVESARLEELGGLLHFYAAVKQAAHQANATDTRTDNKE